MIGSRARNLGRFVGIVGSLVCLLLPATLEANIANGLGIGGRAMAMGSAYTAVADDIMAVYYNPAGLSQLEKHSIMVGYLYAEADLESNSSSPDFKTQSLVPYHLKCPYIALGFNLDKTFTAKSPVHVRVGLINMVPDNFKTVYRVWDPPTSVPRWFRFGDYWDRVHLFGAISLQADRIPWIALGLGFEFIISGTNYLVDRHGVPGLKLILKNPVTGEVVPDGNIDLDVSTRATPHAGVMLYPTENLRIGYSFRNSLTLPVDPVTAQVEVLGIALPLNLKFEGYYWPQQHNLGLSYRFGDLLLLAYDFSWFRWSEFKSISQGRPDPAWDDSLIHRIGAELQPLEGLFFRLGYFFEPSPVPDQVRVSNYLDNDRHVISAGVGFAFRDPFKIIRFPWNLNLMGQYMILPTRNTTKEDAYWPADFESSGRVFSVGCDVSFRF